MEVLNFMAFVVFTALFFISMSNIEDELKEIRKKINK